MSYSYEESCAMEDELILLKKRIQDVLDRWRKDACGYEANVSEARLKGLPHDGMLATMVCLRSCAKELERARKK